MCIRILNDTHLSLENDKVNLHILQHIHWPYLKSQWHELNYLKKDEYESFNKRDPFGSIKTFVRAKKFNKQIGRQAWIWLIENINMYVYHEKLHAESTQAHGQEKYIAN